MYVTVCDVARSCVRSGQNKNNYGVYSVFLWNHVLGLWEEAGASSGNPHKPKEKMLTPLRENQRSQTFFRFCVLAFFYSIVESVEPRKKKVARKRVSLCAPNVPS